MGWAGNDRKSGFNCHQLCWCERKETTLLNIIVTNSALTIGLLFWILMLLWLLFGFWWNYTPAGFNYRPIGGHLLHWFLLFLLGWGIFGFPIVGSR